MIYRNTESTRSALARHTHAKTSQKESKKSLKLCLLSSKTPYRVAKIQAGNILKGPKSTFLKSYFYRVNFFSVYSVTAEVTKILYLGDIGQNKSGTFVESCTKNSECSRARVTLIPVADKFRSTNTSFVAIVAPQRVNSVVSQCVNVIAVRPQQNATHPKRACQGCGNFCHPLTIVHTHIQTLLD